MSDPTNCPRCERELSTAPEGYLWCESCAISVPRDGSPFCIQASGKKVHALGGKIVAAVNLLEQDGHGSKTEVLIALITVTGFLLRRNGVRLEPNVPVALQLPPLMAGWELAHEAQERANAASE